jgi:uncharacterized membrane protein YdjX (TVP38/TMEM64 family)
MIENSDINGSDQIPALFDPVSVSGVRRSYLKMGGLVLFIAVCIVVVHFTPLREYLTDLRAFKTFLLSVGLWAPLVFLLVSAGAIFIGAPRLPLCILGGMLFGFVLGLVISQIATLAGAYGPFLLARYSTRDWVTRKLRRVEKLHKHLRKPTILNVFLFRQIPIWGGITNMLLGSIEMPQATFIIGSFLGFLPQGVIFTLVGSGIVEESLLRALSRIWIAIPLLAAGAYFMWRFISNARRKAGLQKKGGQ